MNRRTSRIVVVLVLVSALPLLGQRGTEGGGAPSSPARSTAKRKLVFRTDPVYPHDLRMNFIGGTVRLKLLISPGGTVKTISPMGGNAALVESSVKAVKEWKFAPADSETVMELNLDFDPRH